MVKRKRNYDIFMGIVTGNINADYHVLVAEMCAPNSTHFTLFCSIFTDKFLTEDP